MSGLVATGRMKTRSTDISAIFRSRRALYKKTETGVPTFAYQQHYNEDAMYYIEGEIYGKVCMGRRGVCVVDLRKYAVHNGELTSTRMGLQID